MPDRGRFYVLHKLPSIHQILITRYSCNNNNFASFSSFISLIHFPLGFAGLEAAKLYLTSSFVWERMDDSTIREILSSSGGGRSPQEKKSNQLEFITTFIINLYAHIFHPWNIENTMNKFSHIRGWIPFSHVRPPHKTDSGKYRQRNNRHTSYTTATEAEQNFVRKVPDTSPYCIIS